MTEALARKPGVITCTDELDAAVDAYGEKLRPSAGLGPPNLRVVWQFLKYRCEVLKGLASDNPVNQGILFRYTPTLLPEADSPLASWRLDRQAAPAVPRWTRDASLFGKSSMTALSSKGSAPPTAPPFRCLCRSLSTARRIWLSPGSSPVETIHGSFSRSGTSIRNNGPQPVRTATVDLKGFVYSVLLSRICPGDRYRTNNSRRCALLLHIRCRRMPMGVFFDSF